VTGINRWPTRLAWLGVGIIAGWLAGYPVAAWVGGLSLALAALTGILTTRRGEKLGVSVKPSSAVPNLGTRVEEILRLAEQQAADHRGEAKREAEGIIEAARAKAQAIIAKAERQAGH
jgi:hypothetical protein